MVIGDGRGVQMFWFSTLKQRKRTTIEIEVSLLALFILFITLMNNYVSKVEIDAWIDAYLNYIVNS